jgi:hypothetical protein
LQRTDAGFIGWKIPPDKSSPQRAQVGRKSRGNKTEKEEKKSFGGNGGKKTELEEDNNFKSADSPQIQNNAVALCFFKALNDPINREHGQLLLAPQAPLPKLTDLTGNAMLV